MSKKFKGKLCVYCTKNLSTTGDHVFAREFFPIEERNNPIKVPACENCNNEKSILEHYLVSVLPFGSHHADANEHLADSVQRRLEKNQKLKRDLKAGMQYKWFLENGRKVQRLTMPFDGKRYTKLFKYIVKGLVWHHWKNVINQSTFVYAATATELSEKLYDKYVFSLNAKETIDNIIGKNTIRYHGSQGMDNQLTVWKFQMYNKLEITEGINRASTVIVITTPKSLNHTMLKKFEI